MRSFLLLLLLVVMNTTFAQKTDEKAVQKTIERFFTGFHNQDSTIIQSTVSDAIILQTIGRDKNGAEQVKTENFDRFIKSIVSIPDTTKFRERLLSFTIKVDGAMANAWTPYEFWVNDAFSHCGVNSFQLFKENGDWKIIYIIDTRRKEDCP
ncbi:MAG: nuclear transport factor 2 family protein [Eudoraea sp.]|nr:nuclear transport factor 2 family protein [Eudoraea sp.]